MKKVCAIIQTRMGSSRLPGKALFKILGKTILEYIAESVRRSETIDDIVVATSAKRDDLPIKLLCDSLGVKVYCGSEKDVLDRFYQAARLHEAGHIVRICGDCPLIDPEIIDRAVRIYFSSNADYCTNALDRSFPDGEDVEVLSFDALEQAWKNAILLSEREHVMPYIKKNPNRFRLVNFKNKEDLSDKRWTLDRREDFEFIKIILESLYPKKKDFHMGDVIGFLSSNPELEKINRHIIPAEGYKKSLAEDRVVDISYTKKVN